MLDFPEGAYTFYVYILTNKSRTVLYTGVTNNLHIRLHQHKTKTNPISFTAKYNAVYLIHYEKYGWIQQAIEREKEIKSLSRMKKLNLVRIQNPNLEFLDNLFQQSF